MKNAEEKLDKLTKSQILMRNKLHALATSYHQSLDVRQQATVHHQQAIRDLMDK